MPDCSHLSLTEEANNEYTLCVEKKCGEQLSFTIQKGEVSIPIIEILTIALEGQNRLLDKGWYVNQADFILDSIDTFLSTNNSEINILQNLSYTDLLGSIMNINKQAKEIIKLYTTPCHNQVSLIHNAQYHDKLRMILVQLETKFELLVQSYYADPLLEAHIEELNIAGIRSMLIKLITEQEMALHPIARAPYPVAQNPSSFFAYAPSVVYVTSPLQPGMTM